MSGLVGILLAIRVLLTCFSDGKHGSSFQTSSRVGGNCGFGCARLPGGVAQPHRRQCRNNVLGYHIVRWYFHLHPGGRLGGRCRPRCSRLVSVCCCFCCAPADYASVITRLRSRFQSLANLDITALSGSAIWPMATKVLGGLTIPRKITRSLSKLGTRVTRQQPCVTRTATRDGSCHLSG